MTITQEILDNAAKALGVDVESLDDKWSNGEKLAEWAVPVLDGKWAIPNEELKHGGQVSIGYLSDTKEFFCGMNVHGIAYGPDIDTAVLLLAAKIGEGME